MCYTRELNFPTNRKKESVEKYGVVGCVSKKCHGVDSWNIFSMKKKTHEKNNHNLSIIVISYSFCMLLHV